MSAPTNNSANTPFTSTPIPITARPGDLSNYGSSSVLSAGPATGTPPSTNFKFPSVIDDKKNRRTSLQVLLPKLPSTDSLSNSPGPASPELKAEGNGLSNWNDNSPKVEGGTSSDKSFESKLARKESYKAQRKNYRREKKRVASELLNSLQDPAVIVLADWLKVRGTLKSWTKLWCVLKPGLLLLYKSPKTKSNHWVGTILLTSCQVIERPSKKDGFCFKLFHPLEQSIWAPRGPDKETIGAVVQPLPTAYLIFRAPSQAAGKCWLDALELSLRCSALLLRSVSGNTKPEIDTLTGRSSHETQWSEADYEKHFNEHGTIQDQITFLNKYLPKTPDKHYMRSLSPLENLRNTPRSPCPSPTPIFQQLYCALSHWERIMSDSPELLYKKKFGVSKTIGTVTTKSLKIGTTSSTGDDDDDDDDDDDYDDDDDGEQNDYDTDNDTDNDNSPFHEIRKSNSMLHVNDGDKIVKQRRKSSPAINVNEMMMAECGKVFRKCQFKSKNLIKIKIYDDTNLDVDNQTDGGTLVLSGPESDSESDVAEIMEAEEFPETNYIHCPEEDTFGGVGEQVEELAEEHKSLIWFLVKQVRPGMDLSKVVLPTFILEPRSFLDKLSDSYYHADILSKAVTEDDPFTRMKTVVKWYLSGFYKKPKGLKKPYNPILGETFRCYWEHENGSRTYYLAEQVSHHPPISAFYVTNRQDGFCISCSILAKSKFYGNSTSAILDGVATLTLLPRGESYTLTVPYAHCKGILMGTLSMELGGKVSIECENTGYRAEIEFKLKPFLGGTEATNVVSGRLKLGKETLATLNGHWDSDIKIKDSRTSQEEVFFAASNEIKARRLKRFTVPIENQAATDSERLWQHVSAAIFRDDQVAATEEKTALEEAQRNSAKERKAMCSDWIPTHFQQDIVTGQWYYKYADLRPWDLRNDLRQYESNYRIVTKTKHHAPMVRTASIVSSEPITLLQTDSRSSLAVLKNTKRVLSSRKLSQSQTSTPDPNEHNSDSSRSDGIITGHSRILDSLANINKKLDENTKKISALQLKMDRMAFEPKRDDQRMALNIRTILYIGIGLLIHIIATWIFTRK